MKNNSDSWKTSSQRLPFRRDQDYVCIQKGSKIVPI
uniref:Uncharacterized protein n=1 Tax=Anguilla anguilla TaxID=7936 RepID=A0A0E9RCC8_ANGAN